ncbi:hypothetical protein F4808DRAFT_66007 [Astrocystis sublimbata]|nr:hypothetical protein F4808DRAFT_66007 [Astrocystis sublimbata]
MSRYDDGYPPRGLAADYYNAHPAGGADAAPPAYPQQDAGHTAYETKPQARLTYEPLEPSYDQPRSDSRGLYVPESRSRPRSLPPPRSDSRDRALVRGGNRYGDSEDSDSDDRARTPLDGAKKFVDNTFTSSTTGLGVGVLGALVGGLAAREAVDYTSNRQHGHGHRSRKEDLEQHKRNQLIGAVVGAAVGALGANAVEKRIEKKRVEDDITQRKWERKWRRPEGDADVIEKMEVYARPRSRSRGYSGERRRDWDERDRLGGPRSHSRSRRGVEREVDPGARSWRNVEDWLSNEGEDAERERDRERDRDRPRSRRQRSRDSYRY